MNALSLYSFFFDYATFRESLMTFLAREDFFLCTITLFLRILINTGITFYMYFLIPSKHVPDWLLRLRGFYGYSTSKVMVLSLMALIFHTNNVDDLELTLIILMAVAVRIKMKSSNVDHNINDENDVFDALWVENYDPAEDPDIDFGRHSKCRVLFQISSALWIGFNALPALKEFDPRQWNLWKGTFDGGMEWRLSGLLLLLTYHALDLLQKGLYGRVVCRSSKRLLPIVTVFLVLIANDRIWDLDADEREGMARVYFFIYLSLFTISIYDIIKIAFVRPHPRFDIRRKQQKKAKYSCMRLVLASGYLLVSGCVTNSLSPYLIVFVFNVMYLLIAMFVDVLIVLTPFVFNRQTLKLLAYLNAILLKFIFLVVLLWMCVGQGITYLRMGALVVVLGLALKDTFVFFGDRLRPLNCVRSLPGASAEQLALNDDICLVCHEEMQRACVTPCKHFYHPHCLLTWLYRSNRCPLCQHVLYINSH